MRSDPTAPTEAQLDAAAATFDLLSVPGRLHLVVLLASSELDVQTLARRTGQAMPAASQQLAKLRAAGVVSARRDGRRQVYRVDDPHIVSVIREMLDHIRPDGRLSAVDGTRGISKLPRFQAAGVGE